MLTLKWKHDINNEQVVNMLFADFIIVTIYYHTTFAVRLTYVTK